MLIDDVTEERYYGNMEFTFLSIHVEVVLSKLVQHLSDMEDVFLEG